MKSLLLCCLATLAPIARAAPPDPVESQYFITRRAIFLGTASQGLHYNVVLELKQPFAHAVYVTVEFENPADPGAPFVAKPKLLAGERFLDTESDSFRAIRNPAQYTVRVTIYEDPTRKILLGSHEQKLEFDVPRKYLRQMKLKLL